MSVLDSTLLRSTGLSLKSETKDHPRPPGNSVHSPSSALSLVAFNPNNPLTKNCVIPAQAGMTGQWMFWVQGATLNPARYVSSRPNAASSTTIAARAASISSAC
ncbi:MAG: hypothetical protein GJU76_08765, partial [Gallionella sp.]|nr:hypothetical protein [Gallionella sp.]